MKNYDISASDVQKLRKLATLEDKTFSNLLSSVVAALGASRSQASMMIANSGAIRMMISRASDNDIRKLAARLGPQKTKEILDIIDAGTSETVNNSEET